MMHARTFLFSLVTLGHVGLLTAQGPARAPATVAAHRTTAPLMLDGRDDDTFWRSIPETSGFREARPAEDTDPSQRTAFRVAYDDDNLYVFVRAHDTAPDSIVRLLSRRDEMTMSDQLIVAIDSYHDRRTGFEFGVNPANVKFDATIRNDGDEDDAWDGVWDVATRVDSLGWTAEYRIPFSQLRYSPADEMTFGIMVYRKLARSSEEDSWPLLRQSRSGSSSQFADLTGLKGIGSPRRAEFVPYVLSQNEPAWRTRGSGVSRRSRSAAISAMLWHRTSCSMPP